MFAYRAWTNFMQWALSAPVQLSQCTRCSNIMSCSTNKRCHNLVSIRELVRYACGPTRCATNLSWEDYTHPSLGGAFGLGNKVVGGFDFVGDAFDGEEFRLDECAAILDDLQFSGTNTPMPDPDPLDQCNGHGTHVAVSYMSSCQHCNLSTFP